MIMTPALVLATLALSTLATSFISGILGMAGGMILMGVLLALLPLPAAMLLHGVVQMASNGWRALLLWRQIDWRVTAGYASGALVALALFVGARLVVDKATALLLLGLTPFAALALPQRLQLNVERRGHALACGLVCVSLSLTAGLSGPVLDAFFVRSMMNRHTVVATKAVTQSLSHALKIAYFGGVLAAGNAGVAPGLAAALVLLAFAGTSLSRRVLERISDTSFRQWTRWTVMTMGGVYLLSALRLMLG
jgi:uncharacterized membrane protein YfcA